MKKCRIYILLILFLLSMVGCGISIDTDKNTPTIDNELSASQQANDVEQPGPGEESGIVPPVRPKFESLAEIKAFFAAPTDSDEEPVDTIANYIDESKVAEICNAAQNLYYPTSTQVQLGSATYFQGNKYLEMLFKYNGILYSFDYFFDCDYVYENEDEPALQNVQVGPYQADFWKRDHPNPQMEYEYYGFVRVDDVYIALMAYGEDMSGFSLDIFDFVPLYSVSDEVIE